MAAASAPSPPPPPPPPPLLDNNSTTSSVSNGPTINQAQTAVDGNGTKPWERAWSVDEMRKGATTWSLASDAGVITIYFDVINIHSMFIFLCPFFYNFFLYCLECYLFLCVIIDMQSIHNFSLLQIPVPEPGN